MPYLLTRPAPAPVPLPANDDDLVVLVDEHDCDVGTAPKLEVHRDGRLHRAVSVFVFDDAGRWLLQRRADGKYHSAGLWSNTACTHPRPGETPVEAAARRLDEEMGVTCLLRPAFSFLYRAELHGGAEPLVEHEYDHVFIGRFDGAPLPAPGEVSAWQWAEAEAVRAAVARSPERFTPWFRLLEAELRERG